MTPLLGFTRAVFVAGVCLTIGTGVGLYVLPDRTADYWAWTIKSPLTAAFFGAGYLSAAVALGFAARAPSWERARIVAVAAFTLTTLALIATLLEWDTFAFGAGGLTEAVAWIWFAVYVALPPAVLLAFVRQERLARDVTWATLPRCRPRGSSAQLPEPGSHSSASVSSPTGAGSSRGGPGRCRRFPRASSAPGSAPTRPCCSGSRSAKGAGCAAASAVLSAVVALALDIGGAIRFSSDLDHDASTVVYLAGRQRIARDPARDLVSRGVAPVLAAGARGYR